MRLGQKFKDGIRPASNTGRARPRVLPFLCVMMFGMLWASPSLALEVESLRDLFVQDRYEEIAARCRQEQVDIEKSELADQILYYCGQAKMKLFEKTGSRDDLNEAISDLERSAYIYYLPSTAFALGRARIAALDQIEDPKLRMFVQQRSFGDMWDAIVKRHAQEDFSREVLSDTILSWSISYYDALIDRIVREEEPVQRWLLARTRMLTDRYRHIVPERGENPTRQQNLRTITGWMKELYESTYFDNHGPVGVLKFRGDRMLEQYDQTDATEPQFLKALSFYDEALSQARSLKAKAVLKERVSYLTSLYNSENKAKKILYYEIGFFHANNALNLMDLVLRKEKSVASVNYPFGPEDLEVLKSLQVNYGQNLSGLLYFLWEKENYHKVVTLRSAFEVTFDWKTKLDDLLRIADAASRLARNEFRRDQRSRDIVNFETYKEICLTSASQAFKYALEKLGREGSAYENTFCTTLDTFTAFLSSFGELAEAAHFNELYGPRCSGSTDGVPEAGP